MEKISLNGSWRMKRAGDDEWLPASVPGSVYSDLLTAHKMEDPYWRDNETAALPLMEHEYTYERNFNVSPVMLGADRLLLRCEGLDTVCALFINGVLIGQAYNMHRVWEFDVGGFVSAGENTLRIVFHSPTRYIKEKQAECQVAGVAESMTGFAHIRKAHCMFGWDWGPRLPDAGIWRDISLVSINGGVSAAFI